MTLATITESSFKYDFRVLLSLLVPNVIPTNQYESQGNSGIVTGLGVKLNGKENSCLRQNRVKLLVTRKVLYKARFRRQSKLKV